MWVGGAGRGRGQDADERMGELGCACIVLEPDETLTLEELRVFLAEQRLQRGGHVAGLRYSNASTHTQACVDELFF